MKMIPQNALFLLLFTVTLFACKKEGPAGPAGAAGQQGVPGPQGPGGTQGKTGSANVTVYTFPSRTFVAWSDFEIHNISKGRVDSSLILGYFNTGSDAAPSWYPIPGPGPVAAYETRYATYFGGAVPNQYLVFSVRVSKPNDLATQYPSAVTFYKTKVFIIPAATVIPGGKKALPDLNNYYEVKEYYGIED
ncbi:hypothetical protein [Chitinophaga barathri]|uniref:Collagen-like protein n=1 Tax=Chitinophaga barathri TaxID=1647451 RepID=A0A3N4MNG6_9BACT|nr:hypothetical protein [Chitinophaga barathri]RPD41600.1 hypothetical protein EG028_09850 [Chitinophaga barathri]